MSKGVAVNKKRIEDVFNRYKGRCFYCNKELTRTGRNSKDDFVFDYLTPLSRGGEDTIENCVPSCASCNAKKGNRTFEEYAAYLIGRKELGSVLAGRLGGLSTLKKYGKKHFSKLGKKERAKKTGNV